MKRLLIFNIVNALTAAWIVYGVLNGGFAFILGMLIGTGLVLAFKRAHDRA